MAVARYGMSKKIASYKPKKIASYKPKVRAQYKPPGPPAGRRDYTRQRAAGPAIPDATKTMRGAATFKPPTQSGGLGLPTVLRPQASTRPVVGSGMDLGLPTAMRGNVSLYDRAARYSGLGLPTVMRGNETVYPNAATYQQPDYGNLLSQIDPNMYQWWDQNVQQKKSMQKTRVSPYAELLARISPNMYQWWDQNVIPPAAGPTPPAAPTPGGPAYPPYQPYTPYHYPSSPSPSYPSYGGGVPPRQAATTRAPTQTYMPDWLSKMVQWRGV